MVNDKNEILLVTEAHTPDVWKIPGGMLNTGTSLLSSPLVLFIFGVLLLTCILLFFFF